MKYILYLLLHGFIVRQDAQIEYSVPLRYVTHTNTVTGIENGFIIQSVYAPEKGHLIIMSEQGETIEVTPKTILYYETEKKL